MKRTKILIILCSLVLSIMAVNVRAINDDHKDVVNNEIDTGIQPAPGGVLFPTVPDGVRLFTICNKVGRNCITVDREAINNNQKYDLFEIKDKEIYLDNSDITLEIFNVMISGEYIIHITGTNKIEYLNNLVREGFIPFTVVGDGTLEIVTSNQIKKNSDGEIYYKCWQVNIAADKSHCGAVAAGDSIKDTKTVNNVEKINVGDVYLLRQTVTKARVLEEGICLAEAEINTSDNTVTFKYGYTVTDIKNKFAGNADAFYNADVNSTMTMQEFNEFPPRLLKSYAQESDNMLTVDGRIAFIDKLIQNGKNVDSLGCETPYLISTNPATEDAQITAAWGLENIKTDLRRSFSSDGHYLINFPEEKNMITTTKKDNIVFESTEEFDPNYHLVVDDITEKITDVQSASVQAKTDKTLVELYDIYMADENDNIIKMENGTYKIKVELNDLLKKYENYQIIYISEDNKVELIDATVEGNYITFNTTHLSKYGVVGTEIKKTGNIITNPKTADSVVTYGLLLVSLAVAIALVVLRINKLKKAN